MTRATFGGEVPSTTARGRRRRADGGGADPDALGIGTVVVDREDDDPDRGVVVNRPPVAAEEWDTYVDENGEQVTVADDNPEYDPEAEVVVVVFQTVLDQIRPDWAAEAPLALGELHAEGASTYAFPPGRLEPIGAIDAGAGSPTPDAAEGPDEGDVEVPDEMEALAERLRGGGNVEVVFRGGTPTLCVEKLGATYLIRPDSTVEGDGPHTDRLVDVAGAYLEDDT